MTTGPGGGRALERLVLPVATGLLLGLTFLPLGGPVLPFLAFAPLAVALRVDRGPGAGLMPGFLAAAVGHGIGLHWMISALSWRTPLAVPVWLAVLGLIGLVAALAVESALRLRRRWGLPFAVGLGLTWVGFEWLAAHMPGVPYAWLNAGGSLVWWPWAAGWAALAGTPLLTFWTVSVGAVFGTALGGRSQRALLLAAAAILLPVAAGWAGGLEAGPRKSVLAVQPGRPAGPDASDLLAWSESLSRAAAGGAPDLVVFPERFLPSSPDESAGDHRLAEMLSAPVLFGAVDSLGREGSPKEVANAAFLARPGEDGREVAHKRRLVPWLESGGVGGAWVQARTYVSGDEPGIFDLGDWRVGVLICYDVAFPHLARALVRQGADALIVISNDDWLDPDAPLRATVAYWQHETLGRLRAAENRVPLLQVATTGRTFSVDPRGRRVTGATGSSPPPLLPTVAALPIALADGGRRVPSQGELLGLIGLATLALGAWPTRVRRSSVRG